MQRNRRKPSDSATQLPYFALREAVAGKWARVWSWMIIVASIVASIGTIALVPTVVTVGGIHLAVLLGLLCLFTFPSVEGAWTHLMEPGWTRRFLHRLRRTQPGVAETTAQMQRITMRLAQWRRWQPYLIWFLIGSFAGLTFMMLSSRWNDYAVLFWFMTGLAIIAILAVTYSSWLCDRLINEKYALMV